MAKLNGVEIKTYKTFGGHEGTVAQATVYVDGKKTGIWSQDSWGGSDDYYGSDLEDIISERAKIFQKGCPSNAKYYSVLDSADVFMDTLLHICQDEKQYKKFKKHMLNGMAVITDGYHVYYCATEKPLTKEIMETEHSSSLNGIAKKMFKNAELIIHTYNGLDDFNIIVDENHPCPEWLIK